MVAYLEEPGYHSGTKVSQRALQVRHVQKVSFRSKNIGGPFDDARGIQRQACYIIH